MPLDLHPLRKDYYLRAIQTLMEESGGEAIAIPFLRIWNKSICTALSTTPEYDSWLQAMNQFHLGKEDFSDRLNGLDHFLDRWMRRWTIGRLRMALEDRVIFR